MVTATLLAAGAGFIGVLRSIDDAAAGCKVAQAAFLINTFVIVLAAALFAFCYAL